MASRLFTRALSTLRKAAPPELRSGISAARREFSLRYRVPSLNSAIAEARESSMVPTEWMRALASQTVRLIDEGIEGSIVECGAWRGGIGILLARLLEDLYDRRPIFLCDSFEGLPQPEAIDGRAAKAWSLDREGPSYYENCRASVTDVRQRLQELGLGERITLVEGWFNESLPKHKASFGPIALLRIDADWYASVQTCLNELYELVVPNGYVVFDDYDTWDGCATAVHEFLGARKLSHRLLHDGCAYFRKA
jgi:O-methyltransferase